MSNFGQSWEVSFITNVTTAYRAGRSGEIQADIGVKIGLRAVNITLKGNNNVMIMMKIMILKIVMMTTTMMIIIR